MHRPLIALSLLAAAAPALAQPAQIQADALIPILNGGGAPADLFTPAFLTDVPEAKLRAIAAQLVAAYGPARRIARIAPAGTNRFALTIDHERADVAAMMTVDAGTGRIAGLVITGGTARLPTLAAAVTELRALPGTTGLAVARLGGDAPVLLAEWNPDRPQAVASSFKLLVLAALVQSIDAGTRRWSDVVPLTVRALPSGILQDWPQDAPLTLHSLAGLMISHSDNSATDTLIALLGRDRIAAIAPLLGWAAHPANDPLLTTLELAKLKGGPDRTLAPRYAAATPAERRALLAGPVTTIPRETIDFATLETRPQYLGTLEWHASPRALIQTLDWFRRQSTRPTSAATTALTLLTINPGLPRPEAAPLAYLGYKGGSEAGVLAMNYLLRTRSGEWYAVSASWNDPDAVLAEQKLVSLMAGVVGLVEKDGQ